MGDYLGERDLRTKDPTRRLHGRPFMSASPGRTARAARRRWILLSAASAVAVLFALTILSRWVGLIGWPLSRRGSSLVRTVSSSPPTG